MDNLENIMKEKRITKTALAERMGTYKQNVNSMLKNPTLETMRKIASALDVPLWRLFATDKDIAHDVSETVSLHCPECGAELCLCVKRKIASSEGV